MPRRYTSAYSRFVIRLQEIGVLLQLARQNSKKAPTPANITLTNSLCRGGVVLLSSHIEGYVEDLGETIIDQIVARGVSKSKVGLSFRYHLSHDMISEIKNTQDPSQIATKLLALWIRDGHIWDSSPTFTQSLSATRFLSDFSNPTHSRIIKLLKRFGYTTCEGDLASRLAADYNACSNMINQIVDQRNKIAHGDPVVTATPTDMTQMIELSKRYCREIDCIVGDWFRVQGCPIR